jgi:hypothetical protein
VVYKFYFILRNSIKCGGYDASGEKWLRAALNRDSCGQKGDCGDDCMVGCGQDFSRVVLLTVCIDQYVQKGECEGECDCECVPDLCRLHQDFP